MLICMSLLLIKLFFENKQEIILNNNNVENFSYNQLIEIIENSNNNKLKTNSITNLIYYRKKLNSFIMFNNFITLIINSYAISLFFNNYYHYSFILFLDYLSYYLYYYKNKKNYLLSQKNKWKEINQYLIYN